MSSNRGRRAQLAVAAICLLLAIGCDPVQEDRHVAFSPSGNQVAFQHGSDGIFIADPKSGELRKVFDPDPSILAVSTPLWSDDETRALFTTARARDANASGTAKSGSPQAAGGQPPTISAPAAWDDAPQGRLFFSQPIDYTAWLVERAADGAFSKPARQFDAHCGHSGYVAANLAIRWHPKQKKVLFINGDSNAGHAVWSFDLETKRKTRLFPPAGQPVPAHVIADFSPDGSRVVCVAAGLNWADALRAQNGVTKEPAANLSGIWIGSTDGTNWWHVAESANSERANVPPGLSNLISQRPASTRDGGLFAFLCDETAPKDSKPRTALFRARIADRKVERIFNTTGDIRDLHWSPDGSQLGFIADDPAPGLKIIDRQGHAHRSLPGRFVRDFAGWNSAGDKLACVAVEKTPLKSQQAKPRQPKPQQSWAFLLLPDPLARDEVLVVDGQSTARTVVSGLRFTFPQWSPKRDQLSTWGTFSPSHRSLASEMGSLGLRQGDPAAIVDVSTGAIRWLAINGDELAQVGHYFLLKHNFPEAREWYRKADKMLPKLESLRPADLAHGLSGAAARRRTFEFLYWYCLTKLGEPNEAAARLVVFDNAHRIEWPPAASRPTGISRPEPKTPEPPASDPALAWSSDKSRHEAETLISISKALSIAQVFLSVDDPDAAHDWFSRRLASADATDRLGNLMAMSQLLLLRNNNRDYADLITDRLAPLLAETFADPPSNDSNPAAEGPAAVRTTLAILAAHAVGPLFCESFLKDLPADFVSQLVPKWEALRSRSQSQVATLYADLFLRAAATRLGHEKERAAETTRILQNPVRSRLMLPDNLEAYFASLRASST
jgi:hypothetical protein